MMVILDYMVEVGEKMLVCLVGELICFEIMGDMIKIGCCGLMMVWFIYCGK